MVRDADDGFGPILRQREDDGCRGKRRRRKEPVYDLLFDDGKNNQETAGRLEFSERDV